MAKFRRNHGDGKSSGGSYLRLAIFAIIVIGLLYVLGDAFTFLNESRPSIADNYTIPTEEEAEAKLYLPRLSDNDIYIEHDHYALAYSEEHEQAHWVAYELTEEELKAPNVPRSNYFNEDKKIRSRSAKHSDYTRSGYTRGHLAPAGDMAHTKEAMEQSFFMSNITPQKWAFNAGIWKELEEQVRDWAYTNDRLYIVTGGVLEAGLPKIGRNGVSVPSYFYKVLLDPDPPSVKAIAFVIPNAVSDQPLLDFAMSVDEVEATTGIDFFADLMAPEEEERLESSYSAAQWPTSQKRYRLRVEKWNNQ